MPSKDDLSKALSQRKNIPPLQRGKGIQLSSDVAEQQSSETADMQESEKAPSQFRKNAEKQVSQDSEIAEKQKEEDAMKQQSKAAIIQESSEAATQDSEISEEQVRYLAKMLQRFTAKEQDQEKAKQQKEDPADLLIQALADVQSPLPELEQFRKIAELQKKKANQGVTIPEALFSIYKSCAISLTLKGKKTTMGDLMAKALIKYLAGEIIPELDQS